MEKNSFNIVKIITVLITPCFFISTSITDFMTSGMMPLKGNNITEAESIDFITPVSFTETGNTKLPPPMPPSPSSSQDDTARQTTIALLRTAIASLQKRIDTRKASEIENDKEITLAKEALNEMLRMQKLLEDENHHVIR